MAPPATQATTPHWPPLAASTLADAAYRAVRDQIVIGTLKPGEFIRERGVSEALRVSRTPLREAMNRLATEGFLERVPNRGYRVHPLPLQELLELYPVVSALEQLAAREVFPTLKKADVDALRRANRDFERAIAGGDAETAIAANEAFHELLTAPCTNRRLGKLLGDLRSQLAGLELWSATRPELNAEAVRQHRDIIQAVSDRNYKRALALLEANRLQTYGALTGQPSRAGTGH